MGVGGGVEGVHIVSQLFVWPLRMSICPSHAKMVSIHYLMKKLLYLIHISYTGVSKIQVKFDFGYNPPIILGVMALFQIDFCLKNGFS